MYVVFCVLPNYHLDFLSLQWTSTSCSSRKGRSDRFNSAPKHMDNINLWFKQTYFYCRGLYKTFRHFCLLSRWHVFGGFLLLGSAERRPLHQFGMQIPDQAPWKAHHIWLELVEEHVKVLLNSSMSYQWLWRKCCTSLYVMKPSGVIWIKLCAVQARCEDACQLLNHWLALFMALTVKLQPC